MTNERDAARAERAQERHERRTRRAVHDRGAVRGPDRDERRAERRVALLDAAIAGIRQHGTGASMDVLAAEAGVTKPILYRHFGDRAGLVTAVADRFASELMVELQAGLNDPSGDPRTLLVHTIDAFVGFVERDPNLYRYLVQSPATDHADARDALGGFLRRVGHEVAVVLGEQLRAAGRDSGGAEAIAQGIVAFVYAAGDQWVERPTMPRAQLVDYLAEFLWSGVQGQGIGGGQ
jgi:AcrR family transcriptional regulator